MRRLLFIVCLAALRAQDVPDAASLLESSKHALDRYPSYQYQYTYTMEGTRPLVTSSLVSVSKSEKTHIDSTRSSFGGGMVVVNDGQTSWAYQAEGNVYLRQDGHPEFEALLVLDRKSVV